MESINLDGEIGHLFVADIEFDEKNTIEKQLLCNEIFPPIIEKQVILESNERSLFQHRKQFSYTNKNKPKSYRATKKSHLTMLEKKIIPLYLQDLNFLIQQVGWKVTKLLLHF